MRCDAFLRVLVPLIGLAIPAMAQVAPDNAVLLDRLGRLERNLHSLQAQLARGGAPREIDIDSPTRIAPRAALPASAADSPPLSDTGTIEDRVDRLGDLTQQLTNQVELLDHQIAMTGQQLSRLQADVDLRFKQIPSSPPAAGGPDATLPPATIPNMGSGASAALDDQDPKALYDDAYARAQRGDYAAAEDRFRRFVDKFPKDRQASDARYWLGDIAYGRQEFRESALQFAEAYKKYPKHRKACEAYALLFSAHPSMPDRVRRAATADRQRLACQG